MGLKEHALELHEDKSDQAWTLSLHTLSNLTYTSPVVFLFLLKECYVAGTLKATKKFVALQQQVQQILHNSPHPGPATFIIHCLYVLPIFGLHSEGFSHLIISALRRFLKANPADRLEAKDLAAHLFVNIVEGFVSHDEKIALKVLEIYDVKLINIENALCKLQEKGVCKFETALVFIEQYISKLIESQSFTTAVALMELFSIRHLGQSFIFTMIENKQFMAAEKWATFMGKPMLCLLVEQYVKRDKLKYAYEIIKKNNLREEFADVYHQCKERKCVRNSKTDRLTCSSLKKLAEKGCWDVAEAKTKGEKQYIEYLVYLAMEAGYSEKVDELCHRYSLQDFQIAQELDATFLDGSHSLDLKEVAVEKIVWVDEVEILLSATTHIEESKVVGVDCEWKPNYIKGSKPNKVSIMQIASNDTVYILDLIKLSEDAPDDLDKCLARILHSPSILKLGYSFQCDMKQLADTYETFKCFKHYEMLLDIQRVFKERTGGLSGLTEKILGVGLNKTRRNSNWEQRPLHQKQLEYAALDAAVLLHIFQHIRKNSQHQEGTGRTEWKSCIVSNTVKPKKSKRDFTAEKQPVPHNDEKPNFS